MSARCNRLYQYRHDFATVHGGCRYSESGCVSVRVSACVACVCVAICPAFVSNAPVFGAIKFSFGRPTMANRLCIGAPAVLVAGVADRFMDVIDGVHEFFEPACARVCE